MILARCPGAANQPLCLFVDRAHNQGNATNKETRVNEITEVYIVTSGEYSDYGISSVYLTIEEAQADAGEWGRVEVWPIGENLRSRGTFHRSVQIDYTTGTESDVHASDAAYLATDERVSVLYWPNGPRIYLNQLGIRVHAETQERADKIYGEVRFRVLADIAAGLPPELIADQKYAGTSHEPWVPTDRVTKASA